MLSPCDYQLLDFGNGRKLEQFGPLLIDRPATSADHHSLQHPQRWSQADLRFERQQEQQGCWSSPAGSHDIDKPWLMPHGELQFELRLTPVGQVGIFPEQQVNATVSGKEEAKGEGKWQEQDQVTQENNDGDTKVER